MVERLNRTLKEAIQLARVNNLDWKGVLQDRINAYRMSPHATTGKTPFELFRGRMPNTMLSPAWMKWDKGARYNGIGQWREREVKKQVQRKEYFDRTKRVRTPSVKLGDKVRVRAPVGCAPFSKLSCEHTVVKLFKNAAKMEDGRIWNLSRVVKVNEGKPGNDANSENLLGGQEKQGDNITIRQGDKNPRTPGQIVGDRIQGDSEKEGRIGDDKHPDRQKWLRGRSTQVPRHLLDDYW